MRRHCLNFLLFIYVYICIYIYRNSSNEWNFCYALAYEICFPFSSWDMMVDDGRASVVEKELDAAFPWMKNGKLPDPNGTRTSSARYIMCNKYIFVNTTTTSFPWFTYLARARRRRVRGDHRTRGKESFSLYVYERGMKSVVSRGKEVNDRVCF